MDPRVRKLAATIAGIDRRVRGLEAGPQLAYSSIEDGSVDEYDANGNLSSQYGQQFDGTHTAASLTGPVPPTPSTPVVTGAVAGLKVTWDGSFADPAAVAPMDFVRVDVHTSMTSGFDAVATQPKYSFTSPRGGECYIPLITGTHFVSLVTRTESGKASVQSAEASGEAAKVSGVDISEDYIYAGDIPVDQISSGVLNALIQTAESGPRIRLSDSYGFQAIGADGDNTLMHVPTDGVAIQIVTDAVVRSMTALGQVAFRGTGNEISTGADMVLSSGTAAPVSPPDLSVDWASFDLSFAKEGVTHAGLAHTDGGFWWSAAANGNFVDIYHDGTDGEAGAYYGYLSTGTGPGMDGVPGGVAAIGNTVYLLGRDNARPNRWFVQSYGATGFVAEWEYDNQPNSPNVPAIGTDGTNIIIAQVSLPGNLHVYSLDPTTGVGSQLFLRDVGPVRNLSGVSVGDFDFADGPKCVVSNNYGAPDGDFQVFRVSDGALHTNKVWDFAEGAPTAGSTWYDGRFWSLSMDDTVYRYSTIVDEIKIDVAYTWRNSAVDGPETDLGARSTITIPARAGWKVSTPPIPTSGGADSAWIYAGVWSGSTPPVEADMHLQWGLPPGKTTAFFSTFALVGDNPPPVNTFGDSTPSRLWSRRGTFNVLGDGSGQWGPLLFGADGTMSVDAPAWVPLTLYANYTPQSFGYIPAYRVWSSGEVQFRGVIDCTAVDTTADVCAIPDDAMPAQVTQFAVATGVGMNDGVLRVGFELEPTPPAIRIFNKTGAIVDWFSLDGIAYERT